MDWMSIVKILTLFTLVLSLYKRWVIPVVCSFVALAAILGWDLALTPTQGHVDSVLFDMMSVFGVSVISLYICLRLQIPAIIGFLIAGVLIGPHGFGLVSGHESIEVLGEIGVVLLLFTIGVEFSLKLLMEMKRFVVIGGLIQVAGTIIFGAVLSKMATFTTGESIFIGFLLCLSSTAIVLKLLDSSGQMNTSHGKLILGILIFQDIVVVPMMLVIPQLAGIGTEWEVSALTNVCWGLLIICGVFFGAQWIVPAIFYRVAKTQSSELFLMSVVVVCFCVAIITSSLGLSLALGAFLAGLIISESEYSHHALGHIMPFQQLFTSFFFVHVGMLLDVHVIWQAPGLIAGLLTLTLVGKAIIGAIAGMALGLALPSALMVGLSLSQMGEFAFVLLAKGTDAELGLNALLTPSEVQLFLAVSVLSMILTPVMMALSRPLGLLVDHLPLPKRIRYGTTAIAETEPSDESNHLIIVGFGVNGRTLAQSAKRAGIPYVILEANPEIVEIARAEGEPIYFGDAMHEAVLKHANISSARSMAIVARDAMSLAKIAEAARSINPNIYIIVRVRKLTEVEGLLEAGADDVIADEFETAVEIFTRVLKKYLIPRTEIEKLAQQVRRDHYEALREQASEPSNFADLKLHLSEIEIDTYRVQKGCKVEGLSLKDSSLRYTYGVTVLLIRRYAQNLPNPSSDIVLQSGDVLVILGHPDKLSKMATLFEAPEDDIPEITGEGAS